MKKCSILMFLSLWGSAALFSLQETWLTTGFEFGNYLAHNTGGTFYSGAPGFNLKGYAFEDGTNIGFFFYYSFLFPIISTEDREGANHNGFQGEFIFGPGFRYGFNDNLKLNFGIGFNWTFIISEYTAQGDPHVLDYSKWQSNLGVGADVGIKYDITDGVYISTGIGLSCLFLNYTSITRSYSPSADETIKIRLFDGRQDEFVLFGFKPYICIGYNYYTQKSVWGKPKNQPPVDNQD
ncbi:MAG: hypothetical protein LBD55_09370 [Treponema sp.]|nr:hypothetical protein [Treponema sp.]